MIYSYIRSYDVISNYLSRVDDTKQIRFSRRALLESARRVVPLRQKWLVVWKILVKSRIISESSNYPNGGGLLGFSKVDLLSQLRSF